MIKRLLIGFASVLMVASLVWAADQQLKDPATSLLDNTLYDAYDNLVAGSKIGTSSSQVSAGNHSHTNMLTGSSTNHYWAEFSAANTIAGKAITASKPVCSDANGDPAVCAGTEGVWQAALTYPVTGPASPTAGAITKWDATGQVLADATRATWAAAQIIGTSASPTSIASGYTIDAANAYGLWLHTTGTGAVNLPALAAGMNLCVSIAVNTATATITPNGTEKIRSAGADKSTLTLTGTSDGYVCLVADGSKWRRAGYEGTLGGT